MPASVLIQICPCPNETCTMSGQDLKKARFYDAQIWFPSFCKVRDSGTKSRVAKNKNLRNKKYFSAFFYYSRIASPRSVEIEKSIITKDSLFSRSLICASCFCDRIHTCLSPDSDMSMSMSKRNMHHVWTRSEIGKILRCSDLVSKFL